MIKNHIKDIILNKLSFYPTQTQQNAIEVLSEFINFTDKNQVFLLRGFAGTGKTTLIKALVDTLSEFKLK